MENEEGSEYIEEGERVGRSAGGRGAMKARRRARKLAAFRWGLVGETDEVVTDSKLKIGRAHV